jgi:uncharacterized protein YjiS (DUF1127 family)
LSLQIKETTMNTRALSHFADTGRRPFPFLPPLRSGLRLLARWYDRHLQRRDLEDLDDDLLRDIGLTRRDVERECVGPFWRL